MKDKYVRLSDWVTPAQLKALTVQAHKELKSRSALLREIISKALKLK